MTRPEDLCEFINQNLLDGLFCYYKSDDNEIVICDGIDNETIDTFDLNNFVGS